MSKPSSGKTLTFFALLVASVVVLSIVSARLWGGKPEKLPDIGTLVISQEMSVENFGQANGLPNPVLKNIFGLQDKSDLQKPLSAFGTDAQLRSQVTKKACLSSGTRIQGLEKDRYEVCDVVRLPSYRLCYAEKTKAQQRAEEIHPFSLGADFWRDAGRRPQPYGNGEGRHSPLRLHRSRFPAANDRPHRVPALGFSCQQIHMRLGLSGRHAAGPDFPVKRRRSSQKLLSANG